MLGSSEGQKMPKTVQSQKILLLLFWDTLYLYLWGSLVPILSVWCFILVLYLPFHKCALLKYTQKHNFLHSYCVYFDWSGMLLVILLVLLFYVFASKKWETCWSKPHSFCPVAKFSVDLKFCLWLYSFKVSISLDSLGLLYMLYIYLIYLLVRRCQWFSALRKRTPSELHCLVILQGGNELTSIDRPPSSPSQYSYTHIYTSRDTQTQTYTRIHIHVHKSTE